MTKEIRRKPNPGRAWEAATGDSPPINLEARFQNGDACFLAYAYLSYCHFDQSGVIEMHFANRTLRVEGRNLRDLYAALAKHMVSAIQQAEASEGGAEHDTSIDKLEVTDEED